MLCGSTSVLAMDSLDHYMSCQKLADEFTIHGVQALSIERVSAMLNDHFKALEDRMRPLPLPAKVGEKSFMTFYDKLHPPKRRRDAERAARRAAAESSSSSSDSDGDQQQPAERHGLQAG